MALQLYLEGLGFRSIGRILKVSNVTVLNWIRAFGEQVAELKSSEQVIYTEMDEVHYLAKLYDTKHLLILFGLDEP